jgi:hypothetical protein
MCTAGPTRSRGRRTVPTPWSASDLLLFVDYADHGKGIFPDLFGVEAARRFIELRTAQRFDEARRMSARLWAGLDGDPAVHVEAGRHGSTSSCSRRCPPRPT